MNYVLVGIAVIFVCFVLWALINGNDFKSKPKEEKKSVSTPPPKNDDFVLVTQEKPKKVKIKKKEEKVSGETQVVPVFTKTQTENETKSVEEDEKEALYQKYVEQERKNDSSDANTDKTEPLPITEKDIEKRIEQIRKNNFESTDGNNDNKNKSIDQNYYGFGIGAGSHHIHGSLRDPNFDPWPDENKQSNFNKPDFMKGNFNGLIDEDDDDIDLAAIDRLMGNSNPFQRRSGLGGGSVKSNLSSSRRFTGEDIVVGQAFGTRKGSVGSSDIN